MNLKIPNWYDTLIGYDFVFDAVSVRRPFHDPCGCSCLWIPTCPHHTSTALTIPVHATCRHLWLCPPSSMRQARGAALSHEGGALEDQYPRFLIPHLEWLEAHSTLWPSFPRRTDPPSFTVVNCLLLWALACLIPITSRHFLRSPPR